MLQCSLLIGNTYVYFQFEDLTDIDTETRRTVSNIILNKVNIQLKYTDIDVLKGLVFQHYLSTCFYR